MDLRGLRMTKNAYFSLLAHTKKLLLVTLYDPTAETGVSFRTDGQKEDGRKSDGGGRTDRRGCRNSYLDC